MSAKLQAPQSQIEGAIDPAFLLRRALALANERKDLKAFVLLCRAAALDPSLAQVHVLMGDLQFRNKNYAMAEAAFRHGVELAPIAAKQNYYLGRSIANQGRDDEAVRFLREAARLRPQWAAAHFYLAACEFSLGMKDAAAVSLEKAIVQAPNLVDAHMLRGRLLVQADRLEEARWPLDLAVALAPNLRRKRDILLATLTRDQLRNMAIG